MSDDSGSLHEAGQQRSLRQRLAYELRERLGLDVLPEHVTTRAEDGAAIYAVVEWRFTLNDRGPGLTLWLTCPRCGAQVEAGPVAGPLSLGALLADEKGIIARRHRCPPEGRGEEPAPPRQPCERVAVGLRLIVDRASVTPR